MEQKPTDQPKGLWTLALASGLGAFVGVILGAVLSNTVGGSIPWVPIGAGLGAATGVGTSFVLANKRKAR